jgi:hypothetical protein
VDFQWDFVWGYVEQLSGWKPARDTRDKVEFAATVAAIGGPVIGIGGALYGIRSHRRLRAEQAASRKEQKEEAQRLSTLLEEREKRQALQLEEHAKRQAERFENDSARFTKLIETLFERRLGVPIQNADNRLSLPLAILSALTLRAALRYLPTFILQNNFEQTAPSPVVKLLTAERSIEKEDGNAKRLDQAANVLRTFRACQTSFYVNQFCITADKASIIANAPASAAQATHAAVLLAMLWSNKLLPSVQAMAKATGSASGGATIAALSAVGHPTPRSPPEAAETAVDAAAAVAEVGSFAAELEAESASLRLSNAGTSLRDMDVKKETTRLLSIPLWSSGIPVEGETAWRGLRGRMMELNSGLEIWIEWYERRLWGGPANMALEQSWATASEA